MKKLISAVLAVLILGSGMGIGADTLAAESADVGPAASNVYYDMGTATSIYKTLQMGDLPIGPGNEKGSFQFELQNPTVPGGKVGTTTYGGTVVLDGVSGYFTYTRPADAPDDMDSFGFRICRPATKKLPRSCGAPAAAIISWDDSVHYPVTLENFGAPWSTGFVDLTFNGDDANALLINNEPVDWWLVDDVAIDGTDLRFAAGWDNQPGNPRNVRLWFKMDDVNMITGTHTISVPFSTSTESGFIDVTYTKL